MDRGTVEMASIGALALLGVVMMLVGARRFGAWARSRGPGSES